jgi:iron-sulfur cluster repair protein YtfE (RIC family)
MADPSITAPEVQERIRKEHERLRELLGQISRELASHRGTPARVTRQLRTLRDELDTHFAEEEDHGFFEQITEQAPRFSGQTQKLSDQHVDMLSKLAVLIDDSEHGDGSDAWWDGLVAEFHALSRELMQHEHEENELLQKAYSVDIGTKD